MLRRFASVMAVGAMAVTSYSVLAAAPAGAEPPKNTIEVTKVVVGENKGAGYQVVVECKRIENDESTQARDAIAGVFNFGEPETLTFPPEGGGPKEVKVPDGRTCTIIETHDGGATHVTVESDQDGNTCTFPEEKADSASVVDGGKTCKVTVTNTFEPPQAGPAGPPGPPGPPGEAAAAQAVVTTARFTG
jgi:Domain of unknown function (DUF5979)